MPDKEGSDDEKKSTKSVVNKKQKQMMGEEGYDIARDMGRVRPSKDKKDATTMTPSKEMRKTQKVNKGPSALELVKKKYGKAVMNVGKKKANEELDLTQVAEAFGGYIVEANGKNGKKNRSSDQRKQDFIDFPGSAFDFGDEDSAAYKQFQKDRKGDVDPRDSMEGEFDKADRDQTPTPPRQRRDFKPEPDSVKFTKKPGEATVKSYIDKSKIDPKIAAREKAKREQAKKNKPTTAEKIDRKKSGKSFQKDLGGEKIVSTSMQDELKKITAKPRKARKRRSDAASFAQVKADIDTADAARRAKKIGEYSKDYEKRLAKAYEKSGSDPFDPLPLPPAKTKTIQGQPQKGQTDQDKASQEFNKQQNILRRLQRQGMADSGATPFKQPPLPDPKTGPASKIKFSKFYKATQARLDRNKKDAEAAAAYRQTPEYALQTGQVDPVTGENLSKDEIKRRFRTNVSKAKGESETMKNVKGNLTKGGLVRTGDSLSTRGGDLDKPKKPKGSVVSNSLEKVKDFARENPVAAFATYDIGKGILGKILRTKSFAPGVVGGTVGRRSARGGGGL